MGQKHNRRFRRVVRKDMKRNIESGFTSQETLTSAATIAARHFVKAGLITAKQALRGCAMVTGIQPDDRWTRGTLRRVWTAARGETWAGQRA